MFNVSWTKCENFKKYVQWNSKLVTELHWIWHKFVDSKCSMAKIWSPTCDKYHLLPTKLYIMKHTIWNIDYFYPRDQSSHFRRPDTWPAHSNFPHLQSIFHHAFGVVRAYVCTCHPFIGNKNQCYWWRLVT